MCLCRILWPSCATATLISMKSGGCSNLQIILSRSIPPSSRPTPSPRPSPSFSPSPLPRLLSTGSGTDAFRGPVNAWAANQSSPALLPHLASPRDGGHHLLVSGLLRHSHPAAGPSRGPRGSARVPCCSVRNGGVGEQKFVESRAVLRRFLPIENWSDRSLDSSLVAPFRRCLSASGP